MFVSRCWASGRVQVRAGVEIHGNGDRSGLSWSSITAKCWNAVFGFCKDWKMTEIINLTEGMMDLLMKIEGKRRRRFVPEHICYRGPGVERLLWQVECGAWERAEPQHTPHLLSLWCFWDRVSLCVLIVLELSMKKDQAGLECRVLCLPLSIGIKSVWVTISDPLWVFMSLFLPETFLLPLETSPPASARVLVVYLRLRVMVGIFFLLFFFFEVGY